MHWKRVSLLALALSMSSVLAQTTPPKPVAPTPITPERELLERVATPFYAPGSITAQILVGKPPADLGFALPAGSRVIGSVATQSQDPSFPSGVTVYFDTALTPDEVAAQFSRILPQKGWKTFPVEGRGPFGDGGFQTTEPFGGSRFYRESPDQTLDVLTRQVDRGTQVTLQQRAMPDLQQFLRVVQNNGPVYADFLPKLMAPPNSTVIQRGGGSSDDNVSQSVGIESKLSRVALYDHYAAQLKKAGWKLSNRAETGKLISTLWTFTQEGKQRVGIFLVNEAGAGQYRATLATQGLE